MAFTSCVIVASFSILVIAVVVSNLETCGLNVKERKITVITLGIISFICTLIWITIHWTYSRRKSKKFIQLIKLSMDISSEVLRKVMCSRILSNAKYGGCLHKFLDHDKHYLYHQWQGSTLCCECPPRGCTLGKSKTLKKWLFKKLYNGNPYHGTHVKYNGHRISEYCLDGFVPNPSLKVDDFDVTILSFFIEHFVPLSSQEISALNDVVSVRNTICHARNTSSFHFKELESMWTKLSEALLILTDSSSRNLLKDQISMLKKVEFDNSDIKILTQKVEHKGKMLEEMNDFLNQNCATKDCVKTTEGIIVSHINTKTECIQDDVKALKEEQMAMSHHFGVLLQSVNDIKIELHLSAENKGLTQDDLGESTERSIEAVGRIDDEHIDERLVVENITKSIQTDEDPNKFMVVTAKQSCIILNLVCLSNVLKDEQSLQFALKSLVCDVIEAGNVDTDFQSSIVVKLKFCSPLTKSELNVIKNTVSTGKKVNSEKLDVYKVSSTPQLLTSKTDPCIIVLTEDSYIPDESDIEVMIWDSIRYFPVVVSPKVIKNVIEFYIPWNMVSLFSKRLYISMLDTKRRIETSKYMLKIDIPSERVSKSSLKIWKDPTNVEEKVETQRKLVSDLIEHDEIRKEKHQPNMPNNIYIMTCALLLFIASLHVIVVVFSLKSQEIRK